ncbi:MAG: NADH-quinone oxidoreductase subunit NuoF [Deltaproteobacteria bacterium]|nr:NADH-quinone oxidoreductase subunit NuoF [Deltaproteobacteria bacterium]
MAIENPKILTKNYGIPDSWTLAVYEKQGGYQSLRKAVEMTPAEIVDQVKAANLRGRGGAGFPAGLKWSFLKPNPPRPNYLVINADEGEPGTFKDRTLMELDPHRCIEGCMIASWALNVHTVYIYVRCELVLSIRRLEQAVREAKAKGILGDKLMGKDFALDIVIHPGAGAYICGEETSLLNSLEGKRGEPRLKPPFPAISGAFGAPTIVNNLETIATIPTVIEMTGEGFSKLSKLHHMKDGGVRLYGVSGHVMKPGVYEAPVGLTLRELIYDLGGGMRPGRTCIGVIPGGSSTPVLREHELVHAPDEKSPMHAWHGKSVFDIPMGVDTIRSTGSMLGTCCAIVMDDSTDVVSAAENLMKFYKHESCGQCTPCREGTGWMLRLCEKLTAGEATQEDLANLYDVANNIIGNTICALGDGAAMPMLGFLQKFRAEFEAKLKPQAAAKSAPRAQSHAHGH